MFLKSRKEIRTLIEKFHYPRQGPGMMWQAVRRSIERRGGEVRLDCDVVEVCRHADRRWSVLVASSGRTERIVGEAIISSMPITELVTKLDPPPSDQVLDAASRLTYRDFLTVCLIVDAPTLFPDNWIYVHDPAVSVARIQNFKNWSPDMVADPSKSTLGLEYFCAEGDALWELPDDELIELGRREVEQIGLARHADVEDGCVFRVPKAYPIYDTDYRGHLEVVQHCVAGLENLQTVGRNGLHRYNNQDHAMLTGILAVRNLVCGEDHDLWRINAEEGYHEYVRVT
jgi:protoporphyrinogen oxidase